MTLSKQQLIHDWSVRWNWWLVIVKLQMAPWFWRSKQAQLQETGDSAICFACREITNCHLTLRPNFLFVVPHQTSLCKTHPAHHFANLRSNIPQTSQLVQWKTTKKLSLKYDWFPEVLPPSMLKKAILPLKHTPRWDPRCTSLWMWRIINNRPNQEKMHVLASWWWNNHV